MTAEPDALSAGTKRYMQELLPCRIILSIK